MLYIVYYYGMLFIIVGIVNKKLIIVTNVVLIFFNLKLSIIIVSLETALEMTEMEFSAARHRYLWYLIGVFL